MGVVHLQVQERVFFVQIFFWDPPDWYVVWSYLRIGVSHMTELQESYCFLQETPIASHIFQPSINPFGIFLSQILPWSFSVTPHCAFRSLHLHSMFLLGILSGNRSFLSIVLPIWPPMSISFRHPWRAHGETDLSGSGWSRFGRRRRVVRWCLMEFPSPSQRSRSNRLHG